MGMTPFSHITARCFVNVPYDRLKQDIDLVLDNNIQPEIGLEGETLYTVPPEDFSATAQTLRDAGLSCTLHAPFFDLAPGALDRHIRRASREKLKKAFALLPVFQPESIVCHLGFERNKHGYKQQDWFGHALETWQELLVIAEAHRVPIMLENTYETTPDQHRHILAALDSPFARFCLDVGHVNAFAQNTWQDWLPTLKPWLGQLHLHDNAGAQDDHLAPGKGNFDFRGLFAYLRRESLSPLITLEPHTVQDLWDSLAALDRMKLLEPETPPKGESIPGSGP